MLLILKLLGNLQHDSKWCKVRVFWWTDYKREQDGIAVVKTYN